MPISGLDEARERLKQLHRSLDLPAKEEELRVLEAQAGREDFWDDADKARAHLRHTQLVKDWVEGWHGLDDRLKAISELYDMARQGEIPDAKTAIAVLQAAVLLGKA